MQQKQVNGSDRKELTQIKRRIDELDVLIRGLYESNVLGKLPDRQYQRMMAQYDEEQITLENRLAEIEGNLKENECKQAQADRFVKLVNKYKHIEELTTPMRNSRSRQKELAKTDLVVAEKLKKESEAARVRANNYYYREKAEAQEESA